MNEKVSIVLGGDSDAGNEQKFLDQVWLDNDFWVKINEKQELKFGLGTMAYVPFAENVEINPANGEVVGKGNIKINYVDAENIFPLAWENGKITECAFTSYRNLKGNDGRTNTFLYLQRHIKENKNYVIYNELFQYSDGQIKPITNLNAIKGFENIAPRIDTKSDKRQFVIDRPNIVNNIAIENNPMGISVFANSLDVLAGIDIVYDSYNNEFIIGKKRIMVSEDAAKRQMTGEMAFDPNDLAYYLIPGQDGEDKQFIHEIDMSLRAAEHETALQNRLNLLSAKCGFGENHYRFDQGGIATATQIISENSTLFRVLKKHEIILESALKELVKIILRIGQNILKIPLNPDVDIKIDFDDSIIEDKDTQFQRDLQLVRDGIMQKWEFRAKYFNEDETEAKRKIGTNMSDDELMGFKNGTESTIS